MKKIIALFLALQISFCFAQNSRSIENTTWRGIDNGRETEVTFLPNGMATYSYHNGTSIMANNNVKWSQNGNKIYWEVNNKFVEKNGEINGDSFRGSAKNIKGLEWTFAYKLVPPNAAPFNPSKELALEQNRLMVERQQAANNPTIPANKATASPQQPAQQTYQQQKPSAPTPPPQRQNPPPQPAPQAAPMTMSDIICQTHEMIMLNQILPFRQQGIMGVGEAQNQFNSEDDVGTRVFLKQYVRQLYADPAWGEKTLRSGQFLKACAKVHRGY